MRSPAGYDLNNPKIFRLPSSLLEISGISLYKGNADTIYAIQDEEAKLFRITWDNKNASQTKFGRKGDYEDLALAQENVYVLKSNGTIYSFPRSEIFKEKTGAVFEWRGLIPPAEYEAMYADETTRKLYILCKQCKADKARTTGYIIDISDSLYRSSEFSIRDSDVRVFSKKIRSSFRPSALAKNPLTSDWYILSGVNKLLVITDRNWIVKAAYPLSVKIFNQPEGISFDAAGNLYISNEGNDFVNGNILKFERQEK